MSFSKTVLLVSATLWISLPSKASQQTQIILLTPTESKDIHFTQDSQPHPSLNGARRYQLSEMGNKGLRVKVSDAARPGRNQQAIPPQADGRPLIRSGLLSQANRSQTKIVRSTPRQLTFSEQIYHSGKDVEALLKGLTQRPLLHDRYLRTRQIALNTLMQQLGKPYRWGGSSPFSGFDCSGLIYFAYKDHIKRPFPRTAKGMFQLQDAASIRLHELEPGDLVFFQIRQDYVDHVGVYLGNNQFIQSPRTGRDIRISKLSDDYWQDHYVGARRVMTPENIR